MDENFRDINVTRFALEILFTALSYGDNRKNPERFQNGEVYEFAEKLLNQDCCSLLPKQFEGLNSYFFDRNIYVDSSDFQVAAYEYVLPVLLNASDEFIPNGNKFLMAETHSHYYSSGWKTVPGYGKSVDLFPEIVGYKPWFGVFSDSIGHFLFFYYPNNPSGIIEIKYYGVDLGGFKIYWKHGMHGLHKVLQVVYLEWLYRSLPR
ncbi:hypothetical protein [Photobacterium ganghwense]|uniref:hypothetical protein n=1 Tax=Photobacterium ganghwense TaxID=320778 RepID=UPI0039EE6BA2